MKINSSPFAEISLWHVFTLLALRLMGVLTCEQFRHALAEADEGTLLVYDAEGRSRLLLSDRLAGRPRPLYTILQYNEKKMQALDKALMKPSAYEAPDGLNHIWFRPNTLGRITPGHTPRPLQTSHPGLSPPLQIA